MLKQIVVKKRMLLKKKARRRFMKEITERAILKRNVPKRASRLLKQFPNLGKDIEAFVRENRIGADSWRRTGAATLDGNTKKRPRMTYKKIQDHLEEKNNRKFSYGAIVKLSVMRNKRRLSSKSYTGVQQIYNLQESKKRVQCQTEY